MAPVGADGRTESLGFCSHGLDTIDRFSLPYTLPYLSRETFFLINYDISLRIRQIFPFLLLETSKGCSRLEEEEEDLDIKIRGGSRNYGGEISLILSITPVVTLQFYAVSQVPRPNDRRGA